MFPITLNNNTVFQVTSYTRPNDIKTRITNITGLSDNDFYLLHNGKILSENSTSIKNKVEVVLKLYGGKGGFGSMLRAIGAQIEKTTNREACRDLSGRRLRDINEEKRLKKWIEQQAEREKEAADRKQKKLERLCEQPKFEFKDEEYDRMRSELPEIIEDSVTQGMKATVSKVGEKRKIQDNKQGGIKKKKLWLDDDLEDLSASSDDSETEDKPRSISVSDDTNSREANLCEASSSSSSCFKEPINDMETKGKDEADLENKSKHQNEENKEETNKSNE